MPRQPGKLVSFTDKNGKIQKGRTFDKETVVNGKIVVYYLTATFHNELENGAPKKRLVDAERLTVIGYVD